MLPPHSTRAQPLGPLCPHSLALYARDPAIVLARAPRTSAAEGLLLMRPALCAGSANTGGEATRRVLRSLIKTDKETVEERALVPKNLKMMTREETHS